MFCSICWLRPFLPVSLLRALSVKVIPNDLSLPQRERRDGSVYDRAFKKLLAALTFAPCLIFVVGGFVWLFLDVVCDLVPRLNWAG